MQKSKIHYLFNRLLIILILWPICGYSQLSVHGYITQAYAISNGPQISGVPNSGTSDLRNLALQFRYDLNDKNNIIIQLSHERMGLSPLMSLKNDLELDWAFFEHRFNENTRAKIGKIQLPFGIYNEIRDVGVLLPFYKLPYGPYGDGNYMSETVDGFSFMHDLIFNYEWHFSFDFYFGRWEWTEWFNITNPITKELQTLVGEAEIKKGGGFEIWLYPPIENLSFAIGSMYGDVSGGISFENGDWLGDRNFLILHSSLDYTNSDYFFRSEYLQIRFDGNPITIRTFYSQLGLYIFDKFQLVAQYDYFGLFNTKITPQSYYAFGAKSGSFDYNNGFAIGFNFHASMNLVIKLENHWNNSFRVEDKAPLLLVDDQINSMHTIISLSASF